MYPEAFADALTSENEVALCVPSKLSALPSIIAASPRVTFRVGLKVPSS